MTPPTAPLSDAGAAVPPGVPAADTLTPADRYQELFVEVQSRRVFADSKTFVDCAPKGDPQAILDAYRREHRQPQFSLAGFVHAHFDPPQVHASHYVSPPDQPLLDHIDSLWPVLTRHPAGHPPQSSLLPLPFPYVVPGGRFAELYYWDSYFTMLGLAQSGCGELLRAMVDNFAYLIDTYGHIPNGTRTYVIFQTKYFKPNIHRILGRIRLEKMTYLVGSSLTLYYSVISFVAIL